VEYFMPCDTLGCATPESIQSLFAALRKRTGCGLGFHGHNDFGMATANALAAIGAGAELLSSTFTGIGERAGNVSTEEVLTARRFLCGRGRGYDLSKLTEICETVSSYSGVTLHPNKPIVGRNAFAHESGLHVDGVLKSPETYENFDPASVGQKRRIFFSRKSGRNAIRHFMEKHGLGIDVQSALQILKESSGKGRSFTEIELVEALR
jgi:homocitrate synthase NifV